MQIPQWKWDEIGIDFIVGLPRTRAGYDSIWVVVDRLTKATHFIPVKTTYNSAVLAKLYMSRIVCLHGIPKKIVSDRGTQFTSHFWQQRHEALGTHLKFSSAYHPQTDGQTERTNQILKDMLRACALLRQVRLGQEAPLCRILLQQQLSGQYEDVTIPSTLREGLQNSVALGPTRQKACVRSRYFA
jgi:transposase InsO family protein